MATDAEILERYPQLAGFLNHPELGPVLRQATDEGFDTQRLQGSLFGTSWFQTNWANARQFEMLRSTDPAEWQMRHQEAAYAVNSLLTRLGVNWVDNQPALLQQLTTEWLRRGQDDWYLYSEISKRVRKNPGLIGDGGAIASKMSEYRELASQYLLKYDDDALAGIAMRDWSQQEDMEAVENQFRSVAKKRYAHLGDELDRGLTVRQIMQPVTNIVAQTLEMPADTVDLNQGRWQELVNYQGEDKKTRTMTISEAERWARHQKEFAFTDTAREEAYGLANTILETFGAVA